MLGNGSPYEHEKQEERIQLAVQRVKESSLPIIYVNQVGGQDELVFDGASFVVDGDCSLKAQLPAFTETVSLTRWQRQGDHWRCVAGELTKPLDGLPSIYAAMTLGLRDYVGEEPLPRRAARPVRRHRFRDHGGGGGGCAGSGSRLGGHDAVALHQPGEPGRCGGGGAAAGHPPGHRLHRAGHEGLRRHAEKAVRRHQRGHHRAEHPEPRARPDPDGALEQVRPYGALHRQQIGDVGGLCHALWRHVRRLFGA